MATLSNLRFGFPAALAVFLTACSGGGGGGESAPAAATPAATRAAVALAPATGVTRLTVPAALADPPFDAPRLLSVPPGFAIELWARVPRARFMALAPNGDVLVSQPGAGRIVLLRPRPNDIPLQFEFADGLKNPHDMVFHRAGGVTWLYVAESDRITRSVYAGGDTQIGTPEIVVDGLPDASTAELGGAYAHQLKNIAIDSGGKLYVSIASSCNACSDDAGADPVRGAIYQYNADGSGGRLFARGIRNAEGLDFIPGTDRLWVVVNGRDEVRYPHDDDFDGDDESDLGKILPAYVDNHVPDLFTAVRDGGNYGWPFCNPVPNGSMSNLSLVRDVETNADGGALDCASADRSSKGIQAHAAPLGMSFLHASAAPAPLRSGALVAMHGCWNCTSLRAGYKVAYFPFDSAGNAGAEIDLVTGFVTDPDARAVWGRPVDAIADAAGNILVSDDFAGAIYRLRPGQ